eukprot:COSAG04_NODE_6688_length_1278_cov_1.130619_2_plen_59_part_00
MPGSSFCSSGPPEGSIVERPTRVRVQSTLLPSEAQRLEAYHKLSPVAPPPIVSAGSLS